MRTDLSDGRGRLTTDERETGRLQWRLLAAAAREYPDRFKVIREALEPYCSYLAKSAERGDRAGVASHIMAAYGMVNDSRVMEAMQPTLIAVNSWTC